ncbi:hypothetical protein ADL12_30660 [Streptomyces regalis]|uniref:Uncharacterized protein n=1 Tax=Streptomyces regalis TaxID=68262 RepID=A0A101JI56_9ACTN|nr:hypothetical protein ADL12_30660 [Streptomyces regalis]
MTTAATLVFHTAELHTTASTLRVGTWSARSSAGALTQVSRGSVRRRQPMFCMAAELSRETTVASGGARARMASAVVPVPPHRSTITRLLVRPARVARSRLEALYMG